MRVLEGAQGPRVVVRGQEVLNFCSNNYLGLADDLRLKEAAIECLKTEGGGSGASRLVCGNMTAHEELEKALAKFKGTERCLLFNTGYMANIGIISSLFGKGDELFLDRLNHASVIDGAMLSGATFHRYPHKDMKGLERLLQNASSSKKRCIITDSIFSMDGDFAPLEEIVSLAKRYECTVMIDEAHALGVIGRQGRGLAEHFGLEKEIDIQMGTLSKAAGAFGAYCCGSKELIEFLINKARSFIYTTGMPPSVAAMAHKAIEIIQAEPQRRQQLWDNAHYMRLELKGMGFDTLYSQTPIIPMMVYNSELAVTFSNKLLEIGIFVSAIRPPTVPPNTARLRLTVMATHTKQDLDYALKQFRKIGKELALI